MKCSWSDLRTLLRPAARSALLSSGTDSPQLMCPHAVCIGAGRRHASVQVCVLQTHPRALRSHTGSRLHLGHYRVLLQPRRAEKHKYIVKQLHCFPLSQRMSLPKKQPISVKATLQGQLLSLHLFRLLTTSTLVSGYDFS